MLHALLDIVLLAVVIAISIVFITIFIFTLKSFFSYFYKWSWCARNVTKYEEQYEEQYEYTQTSTPCPQCFCYLFVKIPIRTLMSDPPLIETYCKQCKEKSRMRYGECLQCSNEPVWNSDGEARSRCSHGIAIYIDA